MSFGGCNIIAFGNVAQLPPVGDYSMFIRKDGNERLLHGYAAYRQFDTVYFLKQCVRQADDYTFRDILLRLRDGESTRKDYDRPLALGFGY